jgi:hypothetical protein
MKNKRLTKNTFHALLLLLILFALPVFAGEPKVYTEEDLEKYATYSTYDPETIARSNEELNRWEKEKAREELLLRKKREAEEREEILKRSEAVVQKTAETSDDKAAPKAKKKRT